MTVLVATASRHGASWEIAEAIAAGLCDAGIPVDLVRLDPDDAEGPDPAAYEAVVLGSAVYAGHWLTAARRFASDHRTALLNRPVWLFSSGPIGTPPRPREDEAVSVQAVVGETQAREHRLFGGKLDRSVLSFPERALVTAIRATDSDDRNWADIAAWTRGIAQVLRPGHDIVTTAPAGRRATF